MSEIIIIGAGAAGLTAAIAAGRRLMADTGKKFKKDQPPVLVLERMDRPGKKILATGNGRCNFSNMHMDAACFHSDTPSLIARVFELFGPEATREFFQTLGIVIKDINGYLYPRSGQASAVLQVLLSELERLPAAIKTGCEVTKIQRVSGGYTLSDTNGQIYRARKVIVACGGCAYPKLGSNGSGYALAQAAGLKVLKPLPALTGLYTQQRFFKRVSGVRTDGKITLYTMDKSGQRLLAEDTGQLQLTDYGVSGIPAFQVSRWASKALDRGQKVTLSLDFMPELSSGECFSYLSDRVKWQREKPAREFFTGMFHQKLGALFLELAGIKDDLPGGALNKKLLGGLCQCIKALPADVIKTGGFESAQVCAGGVDGRELHPWLESKKNPGLYFVGEIVDVDGICGGYNLQWAWSSGYAAGSHSAGHINAGCKSAGKKSAGCI